MIDLQIINKILSLLNWERLICEKHKVMAPGVSERESLMNEEVKYSFPERCYGCARVRDRSKPCKPWPSVRAPGMFPDDPNRKDRLILCPKCASKVKQPMVLAADFPHQLGFTPYMFRKLPGIDLEKPIWEAIQEAVQTIGRKQTEEYMERIGPELSEHFGLKS